VDPNPNSVAKCDVKGVPALRIFKDKKLIATHEGAIGKQQLQSFIDTYVS
jgi:thioredoxin 1